MGIIDNHLAAARRRIRTCYGLVVGENPLDLLWPFAIGLAIDGLIDDTWPSVPATARRRGVGVDGRCSSVTQSCLRGVHHQTLLRELGLLPINRVTAAKAGAKTPRRGQGKRIEKSTYIEEREITLPDGSTTTMSHPGSRAVRVRW